MERKWEDRLLAMENQRAINEWLNVAVPLQIRTGNTEAYKCETRCSKRCLPSGKKKK